MLVWLLSSVHFKFRVQQNRATQSPLYSSYVQGLSDLRCTNTSFISCIYPLLSKTLCTRPFIIYVSISLCTLTYLFTPWSSVLLEKLTRSRLVKKFTAFYGTRRFITAFARAANCTYPEPDQYSPRPPTHFLKIHLNIILPSLALRFLNQQPVCNFPLPHTCYMPRPCNFSRFYHPNNIWRGVQIIELFIMWFSPLPCYLVHFRHKYSPQHPIFQHLQPKFLLQCEYLVVFVLQAEAACKTNTTKYQPQQKLQHTTN